MRRVLRRDIVASEVALAEFKRVTLEGGLALARYYSEIRYYRSSSLLLQNIEKITSKGIYESHTIQPRSSPPDSPSSPTSRSLDIRPPPKPLIVKEQHAQPTRRLPVRSSTARDRTRSSRQ